MNEVQQIEDIGNVMANAENYIQVVTFKIGEEEFAVDILDVKEIIRMMQITPVPNSEHYIEGVLNLRGNVIPVVGLRKRFSFDDIAITSETRIIVMGFEQGVVGFLVDSVSEVLYLDRERISDPPAVVAGIGSDYIKGVAKMEEGRLLILLDLESLLANSNIPHI